MENKELLEKVLNKMIEAPKIVIDTGFRDLDELLCRFDESALVVIGARPSMGKTAFALNIFEHVVKNNHKALYFSLEMSEEQLLQRMLVQCAEVDFHSVRLNALQTRDIEKLQKTKDDLIDLNFKVVESPNLDDIEKEIQEYKPEYVFIDYLQLIRLSEKVDKDRTREISKIMNRLKDIVKENKVFMFVNSQLSRAVENRFDKRPLLSDIRESGSIEERSDAIIFIYRDEYYTNPDNDDYARIKGMAEIIVAKNKFGPVGCFNLLFRSRIPKFYEPVYVQEF